MSLSVRSTKFIEMIKEILKNRIYKIAIISAFAAAQPLPLVDIAFDVAIIYSEIKEYAAQFGLDDASLQRATDDTGTSFVVLKSITKDMVFLSAAALTKWMGTHAVTNTAVGAVKLIPFIGSIAGGTSSYGLSVWTLNTQLDRYVDCSKAVLRKISEEFRDTY